ncbi:MAG: hypothetical protein SXA11_14475 [Cyanobacteriota bacterium]|nr:hypothetical protein [Cyanobacteriota bacterium]
MQSSFKENFPGPSVEKVSQPKISSDILLSLATIPVVFGIFASRSAGKLMSSLGESSEEIFRGDRLHILDFPESQQDA